MIIFCGITYSRRLILVATFCDHDSESIRQARLQRHRELYRHHRDEETHLSRGTAGCQDEDKEIKFVEQQVLICTILLLRKYF